MSIYITSKSNLERRLFSENCSIEKMLLFNGELFMVSLKTLCPILLRGEGGDIFFHAFSRGVGRGGSDPEALSRVRLTPP